MEQTKKETVTRMEVLLLACGAMLTMVVLLAVWTAK